MALLLLVIVLHFPGVLVDTVTTVDDTGILIMAVVVQSMIRQTYMHNIF